MRLAKIVSGGQTGVDQAALRAARRLGIVTGGWAPRGWLTQVGPQPALLAGFGLVEHEQPGYPPRTEANMCDSDATLRIAGNFCSPGEQFTKTLALRYKKQMFDVKWWGTPINVEHYRAALLRFLERNSVRVLNVAGNSERTASGIGAAAEEFLVAVLTY